MVCLSSVFSPALFNADLLVKTQMQFQRNETSHTTGVIVHHSPMGVLIVL